MPDVPVTVIVYVPAGVPLGLVVLPPPVLPPELPQPATRNINSNASAPVLTITRSRSLRIARRTSIEIPNAASASLHGSKRIAPLGKDGGKPDVREVVVMTREPVELAATVTEMHAAPVGNPEHVSVYETLPVFAIVYVAEEPAETVCEEGEALTSDGFAFVTFKTVLPPSKSEPVSGGPYGATMK